MLYHIVPRLSIYMMYAPCLPVHLKVPANGYQLDTLLLDKYHARFSQDLHIKYGPPLVGGRHGKSIRANVSEKAIQLEFYIMLYAPCLFCLHLRVPANGY